MDFNYFDIGIVVIIVITALIGFMRGIVWMGVFLTTWTAAILLAIKFKDAMSQALPVKLNNEVAQTGLAMLLIFLGVLILGAIINYLLHKLINAIGLGPFDRLLGTGLGIVIGALAICLLTMLLSFTEIPKQEHWKSSKFIPKFKEGAAWLQTLVPENLDDLFNEKLNGGKPIGTPQNETQKIPSNAVES